MTDGSRSKRGLGTEGLRFLFFVLYPLLAIVVVPIALAGASSGVRGDELFNDPAYELGLLWGIFSYFGILMWAAATACCAVAWSLLTRTSRSHRLRPWFLASAVLSSALTIDDAFLIHDVVLSDYVASRRCSFSLATPLRSAGISFDSVGSSSAEPTQPCSW
jgi:hypothetical protein